MPGHPAGTGKRRPVLFGGSQRGPKSTPGQLSGKRGTMGSCPPKSDVLPGKPTPGSESGNPTHCDQNSATRNATGAPKPANVEKPCPTNQYQRPFSAFSCSVGKPVTPKPRTTYPTTETPGATHDAGNETATGGTSASHLPKTTGARACGRARRKSPINTPRIICGTTLWPAVRATLSTSPAPPFPLAT